ncbi:helix-turn-helix domain-containing protein [Nocardiopsis sp. N85]|uniref:PucR family transcriptional regulator n=1 Tax=Nocardiopsis sp. N85 TaxID=3029400 RepID=UPI00237F0F92|nr:helix-turn-helix domain-containing protein [Nocardiopsis sp. N85]MDE3723680.1 helix-turn-helix domain-containing protein [Nocardiopsis sp. N85]
MNTPSQPARNGTGSPEDPEERRSAPEETDEEPRTRNGTDDQERVRAETVRRLERSMGVLGTAAVARMEERLGWFRRMSAQDRSWVGLVAQSGVAAFVDWFRNPQRGRPAITVEVFGTAPRELTRSVSLQQTVDMIRVVIEVVEGQVDELAAPGGAQQLREAVLRYTREVAFSSAKVYARAAEARGAWDARLEALIVDALLHGDREDGLQTWGSALGWSLTPVITVAGEIGEEEEEAKVMDDLRAAARRSGHDVLAGTQGRRVVVVVGVGDRYPKEDLPTAAAEPLTGMFGPGPVVVGPAVPDLRSAGASARAAVSGLRAAVAWPDAPRPVSAADLLPERALQGDVEARRQLVQEVYLPLAGAGSPLLDTLSVYLEHASSLEATARMLFVHPNTVRYRLSRIAELTGHTPSDGRGSFVLRIAVALGRLSEAENG